MIILHEPKILALKPIKVGGTSLEIALSKYATRSSVITPITEDDEKIRKNLGFRGPQNYKYNFRETIMLGKRRLAQAGLNRSFPEKYYNHIPAHELREKVGESIWNRYTKIAIIRNPFDYIVSCYFYFSKADSSNEENTRFDTWVLRNPKFLLRNEEIYKINDKIIIDFMVIYEKIEEDLGNLEKNVPLLNGLKDQFKQIRAKGTYRPRAATTDEMFADAPRAFRLIYEIYKDDIEKYGFAVPKVE